MVVREGLGWGSVIGVSMVAVVISNIILEFVAEASTQSMLTDWRYSMMSCKLRRADERDGTPDRVVDELAVSKRRRGEKEEVRECAAHDHRSQLDKKQNRNPAP